MSLPKLVEFYNARHAEKSAALAGVKRKINRIAYLRLLVAAVTIAACFVLYDENYTAFIISLLTGVFIFFYLVRSHFSFFASRVYLSHLVDINDEELRRIRGESFGAEGDEYASKAHPYAADLDIFGKGSVFQYISRSASIPGKNCLAKWLIRGAPGEVIKARQQAIAELKNDTDWRQDFQAIGRKARELPGDAEALLVWVNEPSLWKNKKFYDVLLWVLPALTIAAIFLAIFTPLPASVFILLLLLQAGIVVLNLRYINHHYFHTSSNYKMLQKYAALIRLIESKEYTSAELIRLKAKLSVSGRSAGDSITQLGRFITALDNRNNFLLVGFLNGLFMWDLRFAISMEKWKEKYHTEMGVWFDILAEADVLSSFATFYFNNPEFSFPAINNGEVRLDAKNIAHPLLSETERVANDCLIEKAGRINLVTGSNMAGKSTYLRAVGVNMVLAQSGAPVCATSFDFHPIPMYTSMRIGDSIQSRESTFYAELKRLKQIIEASEKGEILILLDEILKGTNSKDKLTGSIALIRQLIRNSASGIIATHDLALGDMEKEYPGNIKNYSFEVNIENEQFTFDFRLKEGVCKTMNATQLMKKMGITVV
jgi:hypothetical protein